MESTIMPRGMHQGKEISAVPSEYLEWVAREWGDAEDEELLEEIKFVLKDRSANYGHF